MAEKHNVFVAEPMGKKDVTHIAGIGEQLGLRLKEKGYEKASSLLGQFLVLKKDRKSFTGWLRDTVDATNQEADSCYYCLLEWCGNFLS